MTFHAPVGTVNMPAEEIAENIEVLLKRIELKLEKCSKLDKPIS